MIPSFKISCNDIFSNPGVMQDVKIQQDGIDLAMSKLFYHSEFNFLPDNSSSDSLFDLPSTEEVQIKSDFLMAVINLEVLTEVNIPIIKVSLIREKDFFKI
jgi:hypothetical protein